MTIVLDPRCTGYHQPGHPEKPNRVARTVDLLRLQKPIALEWATPAAVTDEVLLRGHTPEHLARLKVEAAFDADTPWHPDIEGHARRSVGAAVRAMELAASGEPAFALMRPPGHHAERDRAMGFCYYSSMALAVLEAKARGLGPVAVFDFDVHHGNGTEDLLKNVEGVAFASVHQGDTYPGTGQADVGFNCFNRSLAGRHSEGRLAADAGGNVAAPLGHPAAVDRVVRRLRCLQQRPPGQWHLGTRGL